MYVNADSVYYTSTDVVLEPKEKFEVSKLGDQTQKLSVSSKSEYHTALVTSWQHNDDYIALVEAAESEQDQYLARQEAGEPEPQYAEEVDETESESDTVDSQEVAEAIAPAEGCEDAVTEESDQQIESPYSNYTPPKYSVLYQDADTLRREILRGVAEGEENDPMVRYLAINMESYFRDYEAETSALKALLSELDAEFVASRIEPQIELLEKWHLSDMNDAALFAGQKVPGFTLANYDGEDVVHYDLLGEKEFVLIDFWASWCGPYIADFPELKKLHAAYTDEDFEIVGVSIDSTIEGWEGSVSVSYGVSAIPKGFLVDSQGCIYERDVRPAALKEFLVDRYGLDESLGEPEEEVEDTQEFSS